MNNVLLNDIKMSLQNLGVENNDNVMIYSSLKSFGYVEGGAKTVIDAIIEAVNCGTVIFPSFRQKDFVHAYENWDIKTTQSDVGIISETFRKMPEVLRSDQEVHSVCAFGKNAEYFTTGHKDGIKRIGVYGDTPFSYSSPYQKMYELNAKVLLLGVDFESNTFGHYVEYRYVNDLLESINDESLKEEAISNVLTFNDTVKYRINNLPIEGSLIWPWFDRIKMQKHMRAKGLISTTVCGKCEITCFNVKDFVDLSFKELERNPFEWTNKGAVLWHRKYEKKI